MRSDLQPVLSQACDNIFTALKECQNQEWASAEDLDKWIEDSAHHICDDTTDVQLALLCVISTFRTILYANGRKTKNTFKEIVQKKAKREFLKQKMAPHWVSHLTELLQRTNVDLASPESYKKWIEEHVRKIKHNSEDYYLVEECVCLAVEQIMTRGLGNPIENLDAFVHKTAKHAYWKKKKRVNLVCFDNACPIAEDASNDDFGLNNADLRREINRALDSINPDTATILRLIYLESMTVKEVAKQLGIPENTVSQRKTRGLAKLKSLVKQQKVLWDWI